MAWVSSKKVYDQDPLKFWAEQAKNLEWIKPWKTVYKEKLPYFNAQLELSS